MERDRSFLVVDDIRFFENEDGTIRGMDIAWYGYPGFGHLTVYDNGEHSHKLYLEEGEEEKPQTFSVDNEFMSQEFCERVLNLAKEFIIKNMTLRDKREDL